MSGRERLSRRLHLLRVLAAHPHRFARLRALATAVTLVTLVVPSVGGVVGLDLWDGRHRWLGQRTDTLGGAVSVVVGLIAFYGITFVINALFGRLFCGFGCPSAQVARSAERVETAARSGTRPALALAIVRTAAFSLLLSAAVLTWVVHPAVLVEGSPRALLATGAAWLVLSAAVFVHGYVWRWSFCRTACPIGTYYTVVQTDHARQFGLHFEPDRAACHDCAVCDEVCPVELEPRKLHLPMAGRGGLSFDGFPASNHCLACGDCVRACELASKKRPSVPLRLGFGSPTRNEPTKEALELDATHRSHE